MVMAEGGLGVPEQVLAVKDGNGALDVRLA